VARTTLDTLTVAELRAVLNWGGDERTTVGEALESMAAATTATAEHELEQATMQRARDDWIAGRDLACREAADAAIAEHADEGEPRAHAAGRKAAGEARVRYERTHPLPPGLPPGRLAEQPTLAKRIAEKVGIA
jgi:hypothetical protein